jgi:hypothetical protein
MVRLTRISCQHGGSMTLGGMPKAQHMPAYRPVLALLRQLSEQADLSQRGLGDRLKRPQSWIYNCETGNRRVDIAEFAAWCRACGADPHQALDRVLGSAAPDKPAAQGRRRRSSERRR